MERPPVKYSEGVFSFITTEHFTLQSARGIINQEISSRVSSFFMTLSSVLVASAFFAQMPGNQLFFLPFAAIAYPLLLFLGEMTFMRIMQLSMMDGIYVRAINRIRHFYIDAAPEAEKYFLFPPYDDNVSVSQYSGYRFSFKSNLLSTANIVGIVNVLSATLLLGILLHNVFRLTTQQIIPLGLGVAIFLYFVQGFLAVRLVRADLFASQFKTRFPFPPADGRHTGVHADDGPHDASHYGPRRPDESA